MRERNNISYRDLVSLCEERFGESRQKGSHVIFKTGLSSDPLITLQSDSNGKAKPYQVRQVLKAIDAIEGVHNAC